MRALVDLTRNSKDDYTRWQAAQSLVKIGAGNSDAIRALVDLTRNSKDDYTRWQAAQSLENILTADQIAEVVIVLGSDSKPNKKRYQVILHCAQNMPYSAFYQAWHHRSYMRLAITFLQYYWSRIALVFALVVQGGVVSANPLAYFLGFAEGFALSALGCALIWVFYRTDWKVIRKKIMKVIKKVRSKK
ncbi:HEAT repeat domain-containing protein [Brasilonema bromeliae]|uniref:HEAT repeat domain-containing protein n=1 Tax=Brasilonema bromeliae TaxID=383615 RepID=UPI0030D81592